MTPKQREMARHALGLTDGRMVSYRNRYTAALNSFSEMEWDDMVRHGWAVRGRDGASSVGFCLTDTGARLVLNASESLDSEDFPDNSPTSPETMGGDRE